jgi:hypothetical protein
MHQEGKAQFGAPFPDLYHDYHDALKLKKNESITIITNKDNQNFTLVVFNKSINLKLTELYIITRKLQFIKAPRWCSSQGHNTTALLVALLISL